MPPADPPGEATLLLRRLGRGEAGAADELFVLVYDELRRRAAAYLRGRPSGDTLQPTALVHEAWLKIASGESLGWKDRAHFLAVAATAMRQHLVDRLRRKGADKRGGGVQHVTVDERLVAGPGPATSTLDLLALHEALERLAQLSERQARIVELRFFGGLTTEEIAAVLSVTTRTVEREWAVARAWLAEQLDDG